MINARAIDYSAAIDDALAKAQGFTQSAEGSSFGWSAIACFSVGSRSNEVGVTWQIFMVSMGRFDNHTDLKQTHQGLLSEVDDARDQF